MGNKRSIVWLINFTMSLIIDLKSYKNILFGVVIGAFITLVISMFSLGITLELIVFLISTISAYIVYFIYTRYKSSK